MMSYFEKKISKQWKEKNVKSMEDLHGKTRQVQGLHCVKSAHIRSFSGPHFPAFGLNTER